MYKLLIIFILVFSHALNGMEGNDELNMQPYPSQNNVGHVERITSDNRQDLFCVGRRYLDDQRRLRFEEHRVPVFADDIGPEMNSVIRALELIGPSLENAAEEKERRETLYERLEEYFRSHNVNDGIWFLYNPQVAFLRDPTTASPLIQVNNLQRTYRGDRELWESDARNQFFVCVTPLQIAAMTADWTAIEWLIRYGANPDGVTNEVQLTPLALLVSLVYWEQEQLGQVTGALYQISGHQTIAAEFVKDAWERAVSSAQQPPPLFERIKSIDIAKTVININWVIIAIYAAILANRYFSM